MVQFPPFGSKRVDGYAIPFSGMLYPFLANTLCFICTLYLAVHDNAVGRAEYLGGGFASLTVALCIRLFGALEAVV